ncbi:MAG: guanosine-5'-triphosphate,3'-diphosphate pyrophosphatase [Pseudomonadota bacterium]
MRANQDEYYAAVDLGSNSFHMVIVRLLSGSVQIVSKNKQKVRLASGLDEHNTLSQESIDIALECIKNFAEKLQDLPNSNVRIVATATLRLATNAVDFIKPAEKLLENKINIISGEEEARQIYLGVAYTSANQGNSLVIDIGGASTEVIIGRDLQAVYLKSFNMGCVTFMDKHFAGGDLTEQRFIDAIEDATKNMAPHKEMFLCFDWHQCLGASGTPQAVTSILIKRNVTDAIRLEQLVALQQECVALQHVSKLDKIDGLEPSRRAIFPAGLAILIALFKNLHIKDMHISGGALREGIIYGMIEEFKKTDRKIQGINQLVSRFHIDRTHSDRAGKVATTLSRQMCSQTKHCSLDTEIVVATAAALHEIGLHIGYKQHHRHGAYILSNIEILGFTQLQRMMIKDLVLMHRGAIDTKLFNGYNERMKFMLINALRVLRLAIILSTRRKDDAIPSARLIINNSQWTLQFDEDDKRQHPLIMTELAHEAWLQYTVGWHLSIS